MPTDPYYTPSESYGGGGGPGRGDYIIPGSPEERALLNQIPDASLGGPVITGGEWTGGGGGGAKSTTTTMPVAPTMPKPTVGEYPDIPEMSEERMRYFTQRAARAPERSLRRRSRKMMGKYDPNDPRYRFAMEGILGEFGAQLSNVYAQAGRTGRAEYMAIEYAPKMQQWQKDIDRINMEFQANMTDYMAQYGQTTGPGLSTGTQQDKQHASDLKYGYGLAP